jgi:hypothetical protein
MLEKLSGSSGDAAKTRRAKGGVPEAYWKYVEEARLSATMDWRMDPLLALQRQREHQPADNNGNAQERQENEDTIAQLLSWLCFVDQRKNDGNDQCKEE